MTGMTRRSFVLSAAADGAAFGPNGPLEIFGSAAHAQGTGLLGVPQAPADQGFAEFRVGDIEVFRIYDGHWEKAHVDTFIHHASVGDTKAALKKASPTDAFVPVPFTVTVAA